MSEDFLKDPSGVLEEYCNAGDLLSLAADVAHYALGYHRGRVAVGLEIESVIRTLEGVVGNTLLALNREEVISVLRTLLREQDLEEEVQAWYRELCEWRREQTAKALDSDRASGRGAPS